jgi:hypothetical protein
MLGTSIVELQGLAGNAAVARMLGGGSPSRIAREVSPPTTSITPAINSPSSRIARAVDAPAPEAPSPALDDPSFNAEGLAHDLLRAIDQSQHTFVMDEHMQEDASKERRQIDFPKVVAALENRTASQIAEIQKRYRDFEGRELIVDLFEGGESGRQSSLTEDQRARISVLLKGTRGEPIPSSVMADLKKFPPEVAARLGAALASKSNASAALQQFEADAIEVHELLFNTLDEPQRERIMALYRRPVAEVKAIDGFFAQHFGSGTLDAALILRLTPLQRSRLLALRKGDWARADAFAIEDKRRSIEALTKEEQADAEPDSSPMGEMIRQQRQKQRANKKAELSGDIEGILDNDRREALADTANLGKSSAQAVAERLNQVLGQRVGESGAELGADLNTALPREHAGIIAHAADSWNTSGSDALIESAAVELVAMEKDHTTSAVKIIETLKSFRALAEHDLRAHVLDPSVPAEEKQAIGDDIPTAVTRIAQKYIEGYRAAYNRMRGGGRTYEQIIESANSADETFIGDLSVGGGRTSDVAELQHAMGNKDVETVKQILRRQPGKQAIDELVGAYNRLGEGRDLLKELFGRAPDGQQMSAEMAETSDVRWMTQGLLTGRDAEQVQEQLDKPAVQMPAGASAGGPEQAPKMAAQAEVDWLTSGGLREFQVTMANRGFTGKVREVGGDPETERLLKASTNQLAMLKMQFAAAQTPAQKQHLLLEIRKLRATLSGDADAYEKDNERVLGEIRSALSFAVSIALAVAIPGAGAGVIAFIQTTALNVAANVAANMLIKGGDYGWDDLEADVFGGVLGAAGGKFGEELLGRVAAKITPAAGKTAATVGEKVGIQTALGKEVSSVVTSGERVAIGAEEFEAREAGHEAATALTEPGQAVTKRPKMGMFEKGSREVGGFFGGMYGAKLYTGDFGLSVEEVLQQLAATAAGKAAHREKGSAAHEVEPSGRKPESSRREHESPTREGEPPAREAETPRREEESPAHDDQPETREDQSTPHETESTPAVDGWLPVAGLDTLNRTDMLIGGPAGREGKVEFFEPRMPHQEIMDVLSPQAREQVADRYKQRLEEFEHYKEEYAKLAAEGTAGAKDPHRPLKHATAVEPEPLPPSEVTASDETDFSKVGAHEDEPASATDTPASDDQATRPETAPVRESRPIDPAAAARVASVAEVAAVLPELAASGRFADRHTAALVEQGRLGLEVLEEILVDPKDWPADLDPSITPATHNVVDHPRLGIRALRKGMVGGELGGGEVVVSRRQSKEDIKRVLRHEINHALRPVSEPGSLQHYKDEFDAYWMDGMFSRTPENERPAAIREHVMKNYPSIAEAYTKNPQLAADIDAYTSPEGNILNSAVWSNVQADILQNKPDRDQLILEDLSYANKDERAALRYNKHFMALLDGLPAQTQATIRDFLNQP